MLSKPAFAFLAALVLLPASTAFAQSYPQSGYPHRRVGSHAVPALTNPRNAGEAANCNATYRGFRLCDWLRPDHSPY